MQFHVRGRALCAWLVLTIAIAPCCAATAAGRDASEPPKASAGETPPATSAADEKAEPADDESPSEEPTTAGPTPAVPPGETTESSDDDPPPRQAVAEENASSASSEAPAGDEGAEPAAVEPAPSEGKLLEAASFKGVRPGETTRAELHAEWGQPQQVSRTTGAERETFTFPTFDKVQVTIVEGVVDSLAIHLEKALPLEAIGQQFEIDGSEPVEVFDEAGKLTGQAYPECGLLVGFAQQAGPPRVAQVVVQPIDARPFLDRAWRRLETHFVDCLADLKQSLELAPGAIGPHCLHVELTLRAGDLEQALESAERVVKREPKRLDRRLLLAKVLAAKGDYAQAIVLAGGVARLKGVARLTLARAHCQWGEALAAGEDHDYAGATQHHLKAIELAQPLTVSQKYSERRAAKEILVDAHLAVAHDIAWGRWQQKSKVVPQWLARGLALADDLIRTEHGSPAARLRVHERALAALAGIDEPPDATRWTRGVTELGGKLHDNAADPLFKAHLAWRLGVALGDAVEIEASRHNLDKALELGELALDYFNHGGPAGEQLPAADYLRGRLCYRLGAIFAVEKSDHLRAIPWFERAVPLLEKPTPATVVDCAKQGETFVSMAVSYWETDKRDEALRLTQQGVQLMERGVEQGLLPKAALAIPYGNLASMHDAQGDAQAAKKFSELAARHEETARQ